MRSSPICRLPQQLPHSLHCRLTGHLSFNQRTHAVPGIRPQQLYSDTVRCFHAAQILLAAGGARQGAGRGHMCSIKPAAHARFHRCRLGKGKQAMPGNIGLLVTSAGKPQQKAHLRKTPPQGLNFI